MFWIETPLPCPIFFIIKYILDNGMKGVSNYYSFDKSIKLFFKDYVYGVTLTKFVSF